MIGELICELFLLLGYIYAAFAFVEKFISFEVPC